MKYYYRVKYYETKQDDFGDLLAFIFCPISWIGGSPTKNSSGWKIQCKKHWWEKWKTCISYGCIPLTGSTSKESALKEMKVLKENGVGLYDFHFDYRGPMNDREFYITEKFDIPSYEL